MRLLVDNFVIIDPNAIEKWEVEVKIEHVST